MNKNNCNLDFNNLSQDELLIELIEFSCIDKFLFENPDKSFDDYFKFLLLNVKNKK